MKIDKIENAEYLDLIKNKVLIKTYKGKDINGLSWRDLQIKIGADLKQSAQFYYVLKLKNENKIYKGIIRSVSESASEPEKPQTNKEYYQELESLKQEIKNISSGSVNTDLLIKVTSQSYENQIQFLKEQLSTKDNYINRLELKIETLENELDECASNDNNKTSISQYIELAQMFLKSKAGGLKPVESLANSDQSDIPQSLLDILGLVDYSKIPQSDLDQLLNYLRIFIQKLPLKG